MPTGAAVDYVLTSDVNGDATWGAVPAPAESAKLTNITYSGGITGITAEVDLKDIYDTHTTGLCIGKGAKMGTLGISNTIVGCEGAKNSNTYGTYNITTLGHKALQYLTSGVQNIAIGFNAGDQITTGGQNICIGDSSKVQSTGGSNIVIGHAAKMNIAGKTNNIVIGPSAYSNESHNVVIGKSSYCTGYLSCAIGYQTYNTENTCFMIGSSTTSFKSPVSLTVTSDARDKTDIIPLSDHVDALAYIDQIEPKAYKMNDREKYNERDDDGNITNTLPNDGSKKDASYSIGFLSQEVDAIEQAMMGDNVLVNKSNADKLGIRYEAMVPILTQAIKDLIAINQDLTARVEALENV